MDLRHEWKHEISSRVHTIDIVMDDWDGFIETCQSEEYSVCSVVIDGESYKNVGIRGKGNTSLSSVASMGSSRYNFKIEFDQYDSAKSYHGLDKLSLNNLIQDNTMMKDSVVHVVLTFCCPLNSFTGSSVLDVVAQMRCGPTAALDVRTLENNARRRFAPPRPLSLCTKKS